MAQQPFARVAPSPGGASVASSGQSQDDVENIGSPSWAPVSGMQSCRFMFSLVFCMYIGIGTKCHAAYRGFLSFVVSICVEEK